MGISAVIGNKAVGITVEMTIRIMIWPAGTDEDDGSVQP